MHLPNRPFYSKHHTFSVRLAGNIQIESSYTPAAALTSHTHITYSSMHTKYNLLVKHINYWGKYSRTGQIIEVVCPAVETLTRRAHKGQSKARPLQAETSCQADSSTWAACLEWPEPRLSSSLPSPCIYRV